MKIVLATGNKKKVEEIQRIVGGLSMEVDTLGSYPDFPEVVEDGDTFQANADKKALEVARYTGQLALADDSGLVVDALDGAPGVYSARYAGPNASDQDNSDKLLSALTDVPMEQRTGRFMCVLSLATPDGKVKRFEGKVEGRISLKPTGNNGFGYDPVFVPVTDDPNHSRSFAEMDASEKDSMSHRGRALAAFAQSLKAGLLQAL
ncbi:MAG: XTP/dITP diphosphatase [Magnetococcales bacterium]|nr:XTP/dITP diphosphatase [Magnetococcales bacterium]